MGPAKGVLCGLGAAGGLVAAAALTLAATRLARKAAPHDSIASEADGSDSSSAITSLQQLNTATGELPDIYEVHLRRVALPNGKLPALVLEICTLRSLDLSSCGLDELPSAISRLTRLEVLVLSSNKLAAVPESIGALRSLTKLDLGSNQLTEVPPGLCSLGKLKTLNLMSNHLTSLPEAFGGLTGLRLLGLKSNALVHLPHSFSRLTSLVELFITDNKLVDLPAGMSRLTSLVKLQASFNSFTQLPAALLKLPKLELLRVAVCNIQALPTGLLSGGALPRLAWFSCAGNPCCPDPPPPEPDLPLVSADELELGQKLGDGASGEVVRAVWNGEMVAVKFFHTDVSPDGRTEDEVALALGLRHPHLTQVLAHVREPPGLVLRLETGKPMALKPTSQHLLRCKWADDASFYVDQSLAVARAVADGLRYCHAQGVCHGDVYGHNVLVDEDMCVTLCDFGASFSYDPSHEPFWEAMEVRAYGLLLRDIAHRTIAAVSTRASTADLAAMAAAAAGPGGAKKFSPERQLSLALRKLAELCAEALPAQRKHFAQICDDLEAMKQQWLAGAAL